MTITVEAAYEDGVLKPKQPVCLPEGAEVRIAISLQDEISDPLAHVIGIGDGPPEGDVAENHDEHLYRLLPIDRGRI